MTLGRTYLGANLNYKLNVGGELGDVKIRTGLDLPQKVEDVNMKDKDQVGKWKKNTLLYESENKFYSVHEDD